MDLEQLVLPGGFRLAAKHDELSVGAPGRRDIAPQGRRASGHRVDRTEAKISFETRQPSEMTPVGVNDSQLTIAGILAVESDL